MCGEREEQHESASRLLCIGLDGATFDLISPWIREGRLPNLRKLIEGGTQSKLTSVIPPLSPQAWSSFMTGVNPGKHGLFGFKSQKKGKYEVQFTNNSFIKARTLWKVLSDMGKRVVVVNVPLTYPPEEINGIMVSGLGTPGTGVNYTFPSDVRKEISELVGDYTVHLHVWGSLDDYNKRKKALDELFKMTEKRATLARHLMTKYPWDFFMVVLTSIDQAQHHFWKYLEEDGGTGNRRFHDAILKVYEQNDKVVGSLLREVDGNVTVVIMSDHGAGRFSGIKIHVDEVLKREKLLCLRTDGNQSISRVVPRLKARMIGLVHTVMKVLIRNLSSDTKDRLLRLVPGTRAKVAGAGLSIVNWTETKVYPGENVDFLRVNRNDLLPRGIVEPGREYEEIVSLVTSKLESLRHPKTGERLIEKVFRKEDLYWGPYLDEAPDLIISTKDYQHVIRGDLVSGNRVKLISVATGESEPSGTHRLNGILIIHGKSVKQGWRISSANIADLFPTILYIMGCPIPKYVDGRVLTEIFLESHLESNPVSYIEVGMNRMGSMVQKEVYTDEENEEIEKHLKELGYFD